MIFPLMLYTLAVGALVAVAALGLEGAFRLSGRPTRWVWAGALLLALTLVATAPYRVAPSGPVSIQLKLPAAAAPLAPHPGSLLDLLAGSLRGALHAATAVPLARLGAAVSHLSWSGWDRALLAGWGALSALALLAFAWTALRYRAIRARAPVARLHDTEVRVAGSLGPAVVGLFRHEIVVPRWLFGVDAQEQRLILAHEAEHRRARDPLLLAGGWLAIVLVPWHPAVWWMASRLRLATEMDCDARVLRRGVEPFAYGSLLITIAGRCAGIRVGVSALADSQSHLERRLVAMIPETRSFPRARGLVLGALALTAVLAACEASMPTAADVKQMDVASLEKNAQKVGFDGLANADYFINGKPATSEEVHALGPEKIATINVIKKAMVKDGVPQDAGGSAQVRIITKDAPAGTDGFEYAERDAGGPDHLEGQRIVVRKLQGAAGEGKEDVLVTSDGARPLFLIDGVVADEAAMRALGPDRIESIVVLKDASATKEYGARGANGVIKITTKK
jgi:TonB-dependent SusC/RagA subfamily outer membrane receptor